MKRVVLITGVAGGIGSATGQVFAEAGWHVVGVDIRKVGEMPSVAHFIQADISSPGAQESILEQISAQEGRLDALVNNAAVQICGPLVEMAPEEWDTVMSNNLRSVFLGVRLVYPMLREQAGAIVNVSSVHAIATSCNIAAYAASKGALLALTRAMALEFGPDGVRVNAILPGAVDTEMLRAGLDRGHVEGDSVDDLVRGLGRKHVLGRVGRPEEIGRAILFLADNEQSSFITGQALIVDGGATARLSTE
jgi:NAD(P)-dependent dehydrogenase (short-subunit alcohol dehydrogenase family)